jgi:lysyl-tRNA synthetase class 2
MGVMHSYPDWRPTASLDTLRLRAELLTRIRRFFSKQDILEVDTPALSVAASTDPALQSFTTVYSGPGPSAATPYYLHTSPEFPMKRLLAAGAGSIYQLCKVFRDGECGAQHNPEFTLLEWYRKGFDHLDLMDEVEQLLTAVLAGIAPLDSVHHWTYRELFLQLADIDPFTVSPHELRVLLETTYNITCVGMRSDDLDGWLDLVMTHVIEPQLGTGLVFVRDYPASQAALSRLRPGTPPVAARFEAYLNGIELANGFHELADAGEQRARFEQDLERRSNNNLMPVDMDERLLSALESGLPDCAGVALGIDRLVMIASGGKSLNDVIAFPFECA